jgi:hypothetical protein
MRALDTHLEVMVRVDFHQHIRMKDSHMNCMHIALKYHLHPYNPIHLGDMLELILGSSHPLVPVLHMGEVDIAVAEVLYHRKMSDLLLPSTAALLLQAAVLLPNNSSVRHHSRNILLASII